MDFHQLYYTSCRTGLSGYAGYQFNAVTPGVSPEVMHEVEAVSSYEPPGTLGHSPTPEQIEGCPVNLCFVPGPEPIVANVAFTGTDYSGRFGNYFAHALVPASGGMWRGPLPIELWKAPLWTREAVADTDLPRLPGPLPTGPLRRDAVDRFLDGTPRRRLLPALLAAVERAALDEERSVVILAADDDEVACWIAAVSFLLPPPMVAKVSFATYQFRPSYSRHHVIGTVPGAEIVADERAFAGFFLFDFTTGEASEVAAGPLPELLAGTGTVAAEPLWRRARALAAGGELRLADWHPIIAAAALLDGGPGIGPDDLDAACAWLGSNARRLDRDTVGRVGAAALGHDAASPDHMTGLADAAAAAGLDELLALAEGRLVTGHLAQASDRGAPAPHAVRLRSARAREQARRGYAQRLAGADAATLVRLLALADAHGVQPDPHTLRTCGSEVVGPRLLRLSDQDDLHAAVRRWPDLRAGTLFHLDQAASADRARVHAVFDAGLDKAVPKAELAALPALHEAALVARGRRDGEPPVDTALAVLSARGPDGRLDEALLTALWPGGWTPDDALALLPGLPDGAAADPVLVPWVKPLLASPRSMDDPVRQKNYGALCKLVDGLPLAGLLPPALHDRVEAVAWIHLAEKPLLATDSRKNAKERYEAGKALVEAYNTPAGAPAAAPAEDYLLLRLSVLLPNLRHDALARLLAGAHDKVVDTYLERLRRTLGGERATAVPAAGAAFATAWTAETELGALPVARSIHEVLLRALPEWRKRDLGGVEREVRRRTGRMTAVQDFQRWREKHCRRRRWLPGRQSQ
ncbi:GTPase-associated protein 1-related protein [Actinomadura sp. 1N219]|uniref:GTPase-associated protein 1-related protein n=1 Tax=Actinomadura sp. 1N219 TaxID=3375152 RepID=UPI0037A7FB53